MAISKHAALADACPASTCGSGAKEQLDAYHRAATLSTVGLVVAIAGVGTGGVLLLTRQRPKAPSQAFLAPYVGAGAAGFTGAF
jgi:hypothetical protein